MENNKISYDVNLVVEDLARQLAQKSAESARNHAIAVSIQTELNELKNKEVNKK